MKARLSSKGQIVLPEPVRSKLGLSAGDSLEVTIEDGRVILTREKSVPPQAVLTKSPVTGLPVLSVPNGPKLTSDQVAALLSDFP